MRQFPISTLVRLSDIKAHTFRVWEQRYNFLKPHRTHKNQRYYTLSQLGELLNIALLRKAGFKLVKLSKLDAADIKKIVEDINDEESRKLREINLLIVSMYSGSIEEFEEILNNCVYYWGIDSTIEDIIIPFLSMIQSSSYLDDSYEIHFVLTALRKKLILGIETAKSFVKLKSKILFFLPQNEHFDLVLLYMSYVAKKNGNQILYMGTNLNLNTLEQVVIDKQPDLLMTFLTAKSKFQIKNFDSFLKENLPELTLVISGFMNHYQETYNLVNTKYIEFSLIKDFMSEHNAMIKNLEYHK